ncbi:MAG: M81 family peptidase [Deltaproteobacteria bacterium]|nr:MAG: M81 family peptidase [Deltaproteobacteria bacterium]
MRGGTLRIAYARISQETNALSGLRTHLRDFEKAHLVPAHVLRWAVHPKGIEAHGFLRNAELTGFVREAKREAKRRGLALELVPLFSAWCVPSGPLTRACFEELVARLLEELRAAGPVDGVYLCLHGAMGVADLDLPTTSSPEGEIARQVRGLVGPGVTVAASLDLHANVTPALVEHVDVLEAYRTNPHRDHVAVGARTARLLVRTLAGEIRPVLTWRSLPMLLGASPTVDVVDPLRTVLRAARRMERLPGVLSASVCMCHPWNDHPELGWSVIVTADAATGEGPRRMEGLADELADLCWRTRDALPEAFVTAEEAIAKVRRATWRRRTGVCVFSDASDVVTAGAPGQNTVLLRTLLEQAQGLVTYVPLRDDDAVAELWDRREGETVEVILGGRLDPVRHPALPVRATLARRVRGIGRQRTLVLDVGTVRIIVSEGPPLAVMPRFFRAAGLRVRDADLIIAKSFFPFMLYFLPYARMVGFIRTVGVTDLDASHAFADGGPVHPRDRVTYWRETDRRRRLDAAGIP